MDQKPLSVTEVAEIFKVSRYTIYQWAREGRIPFLRIGRRVLFPQKSIDEFCDRQLRLETIVTK